MFKAIREWPPAAKLLAWGFVAIVGVCAWSFLASFILVLSLGLLNLDKAVPFMEFWKYWGYYGFGHPVAGGALKTSAITATAIPTVIGLFLFLRNGVPAASKALHGFTRWSTYAERKKAGFYAKNGGIILGRDDRGRLIMFGGDGHVMLTAPTRKGKGVGFVIPNCQYFQGSIVVLDPKRENFDFTAGARAAAGQKVFLFDPLSSTGRSHRYNPLDYVRRDDVKGYDDIQRIAQMIYPNVSGDQAFWNDSARAAFSGFACYLMETPDAPFTIGEIYRLLARPSAVPRVRAAIVNRRNEGLPYSETCVAYLDDYLNNSEDLVNNIRKTATAKLSLWNNPRIDAATSTSDFDLRDIRRALHAIYVGVDVNQIEQLRPLLSLFFQQLVDVNVTTLPRKDETLKHKVLVLLDEFPVLGNMPAIADAFAFIAGYNIRMVPISQSHGQMRDPKVYGADKARTIRENCAVEVTFGVKGVPESEELSKELGYNTVVSTSRSGPALFRALNPNKVSSSQSDAKRELLKPQEIRLLPDTASIITASGLYPTKGRKIRYYEEEPFMTLAAIEPPEVPEIKVQLRMDTGPETDAPPEGDGDEQAPAQEVPHPHSRIVQNEAAAKAEAADELVTEAEALEPPMMHHRASGLLGAVNGADVDLSQFALDDAKTAVDTIIAQLPTAASTRTAAA